MLTPLAIDVSQFGAAASNVEQIRLNLARGLPELCPMPFPHDGTFVIVGSGPGLPDFVEGIRQERMRGRPICAINGAHDFLVDQGIVPTIGLTVDPRPMPQNFTKPQDQTLYALASRVHPETFDRLDGKQILLWHSWSIQEECEALKQKICIGGGTTSGLRAINVAYVWGFRHVVLYGMDSCLAEDRQTKRFTGEKAGAVVDVWVNGRRFWCNHAMAQQAQDFTKIFTIMPDLRLDIHGDGLLAAALDDMQRKGLAPC